MSKRFARAGVAVAVLVGAAIVGSTVPAGSEAFPGANGKIAFAKDDEVGSNIWIADNDGSNQVQLTDAGDLADFDPAWSPDGTKVSFVREFADVQKLFVIDADGTGLTQITPDDVSVGSPTWTADGASLLFDAFPEPNTGSGPALFSVDLDGTDLVQLTTDNRWDRWPSASPDGTQIAFTRDDAESGATEIWVVNSDGSGAVQLTDSGVSSDQSFIPSWSPDGTRIAYEYRTGTPASYFVRTMNADGSGETEVFGPGVGAARWSPDGQLLVLAYAGSPNGIWTIRPDGSGATPVIEGAVYDPAWQRLASPVTPTTPTTAPPAAAAETVTPAFTG